MVAIAAAVEGELLGRLKFIGQGKAAARCGRRAWQLQHCALPPIPAVDGHALRFEAHALEMARSQVEAAGLGERIDFVAGDFLADELPSGYDVLLLFNILHGFTPRAKPGAC